MICEKFAAEGSNIAINYFSRKEPADELAQSLAKYNVKVIVLKGVGFGLSFLELNKLTMLGLWNNG